MNKKENDSGVAIDSSTLLDECQRIANNAIFFDDKSDYRSALLEICVTCGMDVDEIGSKYIEPNAAGQGRREATYPAPACSQGGCP